MKDWIDNSTYEELLRKWRFSNSGDPYLEGEVGVYFAAVMKQKRDENPEEAVRASKNIGW